MELKLGQTKSDKLNSRLPSSVKPEKNIQHKRRGKKRERGKERKREREKKKEK